MAAIQLVSFINNLSVSHLTVAVAPPHASFQLPDGHLDGHLRESVEVRVMVFRERGIEKG